MLRGVSQGGLRVMTRRWAPDGPPVPAGVSGSPPGPYRAGAVYTILDAPLDGDAPRRLSLTANAEGRLLFEVDGAGRQISITGPGATSQAPVLLPVSRAGGLRVLPEMETTLPVRVYNPQTVPLKDVSVSVESAYPTVELLNAKATIAEIPPAAPVDLSPGFKVRFHAAAGDYAPAAIQVGDAAPLTRRATSRISM